MRREEGEKERRKSEKKERRGEGVFFFWIN